MKTAELLSRFAVKQTLVVTKEAFQVGVVGQLLRGLFTCTGPSAGERVM